MRLGPLMLDLEGPSITPEEAELLAHPVTGAVILFSRNIESPAQVRSLCEDLRRKAGRDLLIAVDQEGGRVQRLKDGYSVLPPMLDLGKNGVTEESLQRAQNVGWLMAAEVRAAGFDISFAPVLDLNFGTSEIIGNRSFGREPDNVVRLIRAFLTGMKSVGMHGTGKHFPGHGFVAADSHIAVPVDERSMEEIRRDCLSVFKALAPELGAMMPAHVIYPAFDPNPAGFSRRWLQDVLRTELKFEGCIFSDDLAMKGATVMGDFRARAQAAMDAGCDMVLVCNDRKGAIEVLDSLPQKLAKEKEARIKHLCRDHEPDSLAHLHASKQWQQAQQFLSA